jgi:hypothetical protein
MNDVSKIKGLLLKWLILHGQKPIQVTNLMDSNIFGLDLYWLENKGYITENTKTDVYKYQLTDKAIEWIGEKNVSM